MGAKFPDRPGNSVTLLPCGVSSRTLWVEDTADAVWGGSVYINGGQTGFIVPNVLTANGYGSADIEPLDPGSIIQDWRRSL